MNFVTNKKMWFGISLCILLIGLGSLVLNGLNLGIDFTGGTIIHLRIGETFQVSEVREALEPLDLEDSVIQGSTGPDGERTEVIIRTPSLDENERNQVIEAIRDRWPGVGTEDVLRTDNVGATIGEELRAQAFWALLIASLGMIIYISYRFELRFALAAIAAILHDAFIVLAVFSLFQVEINSPFIAALLTIIGYSINDTIVVFDRMRESLKMDKKASLGDIIRTSVRMTITRSLNTSATTLLVLLSLFILGGVTLRPFILALLIGVVSGTYSSIFIAANVWAVLAERFNPWFLKKERRPA